MPRLIPVFYPMLERMWATRKNPVSPSSPEGEQAERGRNKVIRVQIHQWDLSATRRRVRAAMLVPPAVEGSSLPGNRRDRADTLGDLRNQATNSSTLKGDNGSHIGGKDRLAVQYCVIGGGAEQ